MIDELIIICVDCFAGLVNSYFNKSFKPSQIVVRRRKKTGLPMVRLVTLDPVLTIWPLDSWPRTRGEVNLNRPA